MQVRRWTRALGLIVRPPAVAFRSARRCSKQTTLSVDWSHPPLQEPASQSCQAVIGSGMGCRAALLASPGSPAVLLLNVPPLALCGATGRCQLSLRTSAGWLRCGADRSSAVKAAGGWPADGRGPGPPASCRAEMLAGRRSRGAAGGSPRTRTLPVRADSRSPGSGHQQLGPGMAGPPAPDRACQRLSGPVRLQV